MLYPDALSHVPFGNFPFVPRIAVRVIIRIVRFGCSIMAFVSLCLGVVSFRMHPLWHNSASNFVFQNSPPQSACISYTREQQAASRVLIISISAFLASDFCLNGFVTMYLDLSSSTMSRCWYPVPGVAGLILVTRSA